MHPSSLLAIGLSVGLLVVVGACGSNDEDLFGSPDGAAGTAGSGGANGAGGTSMSGGNAGSGGDGVGGASATGGGGNGTGAASGEDAAAGGSAGGDASAAGGAGEDAAAGSAGSGGDSADAAADTGFLPEGATTCSLGQECTGFPTSGFPRNATAVNNCAGMSHQTDCCGSLLIFGINHGSRTTLCPAETACRAQYPNPAGCDSKTIKTDTGETTTNPNDVRVRCVNPSSGTCTCETFVCTKDACRATSVAVGSCG
jgi:hypothetical protein